MGSLLKALESPSGLNAAAERFKKGIDPSTDTADGLAFVKFVASPPVKPPEPPKTTTGQREPMPPNPKAILGASKPMLGLVPPVALIWMAKGMEFGAHGRDANGVQVRERGYGEYNWRESPVEEMTYVHAMQRHFADYLDGEDVASDSKVKHLAHIMDCCAILLDAEECGTLIRNRPKKGKASDLIERLTIKKKQPAPVPVDNTFSVGSSFTFDPEHFKRVINEFTEKYKDTLYGEDSKNGGRRGRGAGSKTRKPRARKGKANHHGRGRKARQ